MYNHCSVPNCNSLRRDILFHVLPCVDILRLNKWLQCINNDSLRELSLGELSKRFVCHKHFEKRFITAKSRLRVQAYPTLFSESEISSGIPALHHEDLENRPCDHDYARKRHYDHNYSKAERPLGTSYLHPNLSDAMTSSFCLSTSTSKEQFIAADVPSKVTVQPALNYSKMVNPACEIMRPLETDFTISKPGCSTMTSNIKHPNVDMPPAVNLQSTSDSTDFSVVQKLNKNKGHMPSGTESGNRKRKRIIQKMSELSPKCRQMYQRYIKSKRQLRSRNKRVLKFNLNELFEKLTKNMGEHAKKLFWMQVKMAEKHKKGRRFTLDEKIISLSILKQSPKCYKFLKQIFILPSITTLKKLVSKLNIESGINKHVFEFLKQEVQSWKTEKKFCSIIFDEMALEPGLTYESHKDKIVGFVELNKSKDQFADHALVFVIKGAIYKWQQPIAFYFCEGATSGIELKAILKNIVHAVGQTGLIPVALISDQGSAFQSALKNLQEETRREQIISNGILDDVISLGGFNLSVIYDPPHLIKGLRNNFLSKDIICEDKIATWKDIVDVYKADCNHAETRLLHKLNDEHVIPEKIKKMKVKNCVRVFSKTMAAALSYTSQFSHYSDGREVSRTLKNTSEIVRFFDDLFDSVNGASTMPKKGRGKTLPRAVTDSSPHHHFWSQAILKLKQIKFIDKNGKQVVVPSIKNFITTTESFKRLWQLLKNKNIKVMRPRYFNSDCIENFFGQVRAYNSRNNNPNCQTFINTFKSLLITGFIKFHSDTFNCEKDDSEQLLKINSLFCNATTSEVDDIDSNDVPINTPAGDIVQDSVQAARQERLNIHSRAYTTGWVVRKMFQKIKCISCKKQFITAETSDIHTWINHKEYKKISNKNLVYPSEYVVRNFGTILKLTNNYLELHAHEKGVSDKIKNMVLCENIINIGCESHLAQTMDLFIRITVKLGIFNWCNIINKILRGVDVERLQNKLLPKNQNKALRKYMKKLKIKCLKHFYIFYFQE